MRILLVEDVEAEAFLIATLLTEVAKEIEIAHSMAEAWHFLQTRGKFDVVLLDLNLPDSTPATTVEEIAKIKQTGRKVVAITGLDISTVMERALATGADAVFYKGDVSLADKIKAQLIQK